jgi:tRNA nucleotidyltransferase/poly(A) polymerase
MPVLILFKLIRTEKIQKIFVFIFYGKMSSDMNNINNINIPKKYRSILNKISFVAKENNFDAYIVGGFVRDLFINRKPKDLDIMICPKDNVLDSHLSGINFAKMFAHKYKFHEPIIFERFGTAKLCIDSEEIEFVVPRKEYYASNSRNPNIQFTSLKQDAFRRDFTINALFLRLSDMSIFDLTSSGLNDIRNKIIRVTDPPNAKVIFNQDPLRILRAIRQSLQLGFNIESKTYSAMKLSVHRIKIVSHERIRDELDKILVEEKSSKAFIIMDNIDLLAEILPEVARLKNLKQHLKYYIDNPFIHTLKVLDRTQNNIILRMATLLHDIGKHMIHRNFDGEISLYKHGIESAKAAESILKRFRYSKEFIRKTVSIIEKHVYPKMYSKDWTNSTIRRFVRKCGEEFNLIMKFAEANFEKGRNDEKFIELSSKIKKLNSQNMLYSKSELLSGNELMTAFNKPAGKWIQTAKKKIEEMQIENPTITKDKAIKAIKKASRSDSKS